MSRGWLTALVWTTAMVQAYFFSGLSSGSFSVNLLLVILFFVAISSSLRFSLLLAAWGGLWLDVAAGQLGVRMAVMLLVVLLIIWQQRVLGLEFSRRGPRLVSLLLLSLIYNFLLLLAGWLSLQAVHWQWSLLMWWSVEAGLTVGLAWLVGKRLQAGLLATSRRLP